MSRGRTFPFALLVDAVLEGLASLEDRSLGGFDLDFLAGAGIAGSAGRPGLHFERAKADDLNLVAIGQGLGYNIDEGVNGLFGILLVGAGLLRQGGDQFSLVLGKFLLVVFRALNGLI